MHIHACNLSTWPPLATHFPAALQSSAYKSPRGRLCIHSTADANNINRLQGRRSVVCKRFLICLAKKMSRGGKYRSNTEAHKWPRLGAHLRVFQERSRASVGVHGRLCQGGALDRWTWRTWREHPSYFSPLAFQREKRPVDVGVGASLEECVAINNECFKKTYLPEHPSFLHLPVCSSHPPVSPANGTDGCAGSNVNISPSRSLLAAPLCYRNRLQLRGKWRPIKILTKHG